MHSSIKQTFFIGLLFLSVFSFGQSFNNTPSSIAGRAGCDPVTHLHATIENITTVHLSWMPPEESLSFSIYKDGGLLGTQNDTVFTDENVSYGTHYYCVIANYDTCISNPTCISVTVSPVECNPPENLTATIHYEEDVPFFMLRWNSVSYLQYYNVYINSQLLAIHVTDTFFIVNEGLSGVEYCFNVTTQCEYTESEFSNTACATIPPINECTPPSLFIAALSFAEMQINLAWIIDANANSYNIYRNNIFLANVSSDHFTDTDIALGSTYCYTISSQCDDGESEQTDPQCIENVSIEEYANANLFEIFPNPASEMLFVKSDIPILHVQIYNMIGQQIFCTSNWDEATAISVLDWKSGIYIVKITTNITTITKKVIIL